MTIELASGEERQLDVQLVAVVSPQGLSVYDVFIRTNYYPPTAADNYIHARIKNNTDIPVTRAITCHYWESWMEPQQVPDKTQILSINPGQTIEYTEHFHGNNYKEYQMAMWLTSEEQELTRQIPFQAGYHLRPSQGDPDIEGYVVEVGSDYVVLRYAEFGAQRKWQCTVYTPPLIANLPFEQRIGPLTWRTPWAYCGFWLVTGLLSGRLYEADLENQHETWIQFRTL